MEMTCQGSFTGGHLVVPDQQLTIQFLPGDVIFLRSSLIPYIITPCIGERSSLVFFSPSRPAMKVQSTHKPGKTILETLIDQPVLRQWEKGKLEAQKKQLSKGLKPYPTNESDLTERKLKSAEMRKRKYVRYAEGQVEKEEMDEG